MDSHPTAARTRNARAVRATTSEDWNVVLKALRLHYPDYVHPSRLVKVCNPPKSEPQHRTEAVIKRTLDSLCGYKQAERWSIARPVDGDTYKAAELRGPLYADM